jgi:dihydrofolate synthase/folylpolyglutamate synthase
VTSSGWDAIWRAVDARARFGMKPGLERMAGLLEALGHPERGLSCIQVAGTNGKGSTAYALASLLRAAGHRTGLFVSPHLLHPSERIRLDGVPLDEKIALDAWHELEPHLEALQPTYFELLTALALTSFRRAGLGWAVLECGLGGRWDATSAVTPRLALLTNVGADHLGVLGPTLADVARDKAHVAPPGGILLCAETDPALREVVRRTVEARGARLVLHDPSMGTCPPAPREKLRLVDPRGGAWLEPPVDTAGWRSAAGLALAAFRLLSAGEAGAGCRLAEDEWRGRFQVVSRDPPRVLDVAHNPPALAHLAAELARHWPDRRFNALLAGMRDKDLAGNLAALRPVLAEVRILLVDGHPRAADRPEWEEAARRAGVTATFCRRAQLDLLRNGIESGRPTDDPWMREALLVGGSFLSVAAWLGGTELPPGL